MKSYLAVAIVVMSLLAGCAAPSSAPAETTPTPTVTYAVDTPPAQPARSLSLSSAGSMRADFSKPYTVAAASASLHYGELRLSLDGATLTRAECGSAAAPSWDACRNSQPLGPSNEVRAGDQMTIYPSSDAHGKLLQVHDELAGDQVILSLTMG